MDPQKTTDGDCVSSNGTGNIEPAVPGEVRGPRVGDQVCLGLAFRSTRLYDAVLPLPRIVLPHSTRFLFPFLPPQVRPPYRTFSPIRFPYHSSNSNNIPADCRPTCRSSVCIVFLICNCSYRYIAIDLCNKGSQVLVPSFILSSHLYILCGHRSIAVTTRRTCHTVLN